MADNVTLDPGSGGDTIAADEIASAKYQRVKITLGADGTNDGDVASGNPMPISHAALTELAAAIDTEVQCDIVGALPAGTNAIGKLAANSGVDIGDVDVTSLPSTVHSADFDTGGGTDTTLAFGIAVPASGGAAVVPGDATAGLKVDLGADNDVTVTGTVTEANSAAIAASASVLDDWDESDRAKVNPIVGQAGVAAGAGSVSALTQRVTLASDDPGVALLGTIDADTGNIATSVGVLDDWDNAASDGASVSGDVAHDTADAGEPVKVGAKATTALSGLTLVADADRTNLFAGVDGVQIIRQDCNLEDIVTATPVAITDGSSTSVISAQGSGIKFYLTEITIANSSSSNVTVDLRDGTAGSVKWTFPVPANGGVVKTFKVPLPFSANTAMAADPSAAASTITVSALGFKSKV